ncbi:hypothetical protein PTSG_05916 [Salpingoeca rosetta]|uniref:Uncharacterized protein n=1 Tax=Salpingoeca rosetta (strain ATCC 50818 / BSB-021) TaxID=946362 RepID=F2UD57_SALR5|nr:uncharacterized protein PTSG_05916 [Salpingoeca rosetta]EGD74552.1 hypothetical protein PTSG_05916 [Salpingoeca rosetta]|eukprot:XP_004992809.1 hypothetical protein PTSG_05916 [Salpingoeca rosetta]
MDCWDDDLFAAPPSDSHPLRCAICQCIMKNAVQCSNQHCFGEGCLKKALERVSECPICRETLTTTTMQPASLARSLVDTLLVYCGNKTEGCLMQIPLEKKSSHEEECGYRYVSCPNDGCRKRMYQKDLASHTLTCEHRRMPCDVCKCELSVSDVHSHACLTSLTTRLASLENTVTSLKKQLKTEQEQRSVLQTLLTDMLASGDARPAMSKPAPSSASPRTRDLGLTLEVQKRTRKDSPRPAVGDVVQSRDPASHPPEGSLSNAAGWIVIDEHDHQPFQIHSFLNKTYWYREREVSFVAHPNDIVTRENAIVGVPVVRGPHWKWGDQGGTSYGFIVESAASRGDGWCKVKWRNNLVASYRVGAEGSYDLTVADMRRLARPS